MSIIKSFYFVFLRIYLMSYISKYTADSERYLYIPELKSEWTEVTVINTTYSSIAVNIQCNELT